MQKNILKFRSFFGVGLLFAAAVLGYAYFLSSVKRECYQIFNVKETITWAQSQNSIYRTHSHATVDNFLLSQDVWRDVVFSTKIVNPQDCGLLYDYQDPNTYRFVYFQKNSRLVTIGQLAEGKARSIKPTTVDLPSTIDVTLTRKSGVLSVKVGSQELWEKNVSTNAGKFGLIVNSVQVPPAIFYQISAKGFLADGKSVSADVRAKSSAQIVPAFHSFLVFYLAFMLFVVFCPLLFVAAPRRFEKDPRILKFLKSTGPFLLHIFLAVCFFWPFIVRGEVAVFSYDNLGEIFPLFYYAQQNFLNIIHGHAAWLWNPWIQNGFPFYSNHWDMIYYPFNWPVFLAPSAHLLTALTFKSFLETVLIGFLAYGFFAIEFENRRWALFCSVVYQLGSLLIFTMGIFPATSTYFAMTLYLYLLWSFSRRRALANFLLLALAVVLILTSANVAFIFYACLSLAVVSVYRFFSLKKDALKVFIVTACSWLTGMLISSVRIFSCLDGVVSSNRMAENFHTIHDRSYMALRLFIPEIAGWMGTDAFNVLKSPNLNLIYSQLELPSSNPQNSFFVYFGILPALILAAGFLVPTKGRQTFWKVYSLIALGVALLWQPIWGVLSILCLPLNHYCYHMIILPVGICAAIGFGGIALENGQWQNTNFYRNMILFLGFVIAYGCVFLTYLFPSIAGVSRLVFLAGAVIILGFYVLRRYKSGAAKKFLEGIDFVFQVLGMTLLIMTTVYLMLDPIPKKEDLGGNLMIPFLWFCAAIALILKGYGRLSKDSLNLKEPLARSAFLFAAAAIFSAIWVYSLAGNMFMNLEKPLRVYTLDLLVGILRLFLLLQIGLLGFCAWEKKILSARWIFVLFLILTSLDLIVFNARFNNIAAPFYFKNAFYPKAFTYRDMNPALRARMDLVNYRVSHQDRQDFNANKNLVFSLPSYTGTVGYMTKRFSKLLTAFGYVEGIYMLYPEDATDNARFLDLSAVRYAFDENGKLVERPSALGRLNLFFSAQTFDSDEKLLARLTDSAFDAHKTILLSSATVLLNNEPKDARIIAIDKASPDEIVSHVSAPSQGYLLFDDSYDEGWKAYLNDIQTPIIRANYNFMACAIPSAGEYRIRFVYQPPAYQRNLYLSLIGLIGFFIVLGILIMTRIVWPQAK